MSYCRWSTDDFGCDLYCYQDVSGGWTTHVASNKRVYTVPVPPPVAWAPNSDNAAWVERDQQMSALKEGAGYALVPIGLPCDGETFHDPTLTEFRDRIVSLRAMGYQCPDSVLAEIDEEIAHALVVQGGGE